MEVVFAFLFAVAAIVAVWALTLLSVEKERRRRSDDELAALSVLSRGPLSASDAAPQPVAAESSREPARAEDGSDPERLRATIARAHPVIARAMELMAETRARAAGASAGRTGDVATAELRDRGFAETVLAIRELLSAATRTEEELAALVGEAADVRRRLEVREVASSWNPLTAPPPASPALSVAARHGEQMADQGQRLRALLLTSSLHAARLAASMRSLEKASKALGIRAESLGPLASSLSGLADRVNLLALHAAFQEPGEPSPQATAGREPGGVTAAELRAVYDEMRGLSRELLAAAQSGHDGATSLGEAVGASLELSETVQGAAGRVVDRLTALEGASHSLLESLGTAQRLVSETEELQRALSRRVAGAVEREAAAIRSLEERTEHVVALALRLEKALSSVRDLRQPANRALGALEDVRARSEPAPPALEPALGELASALAEIERVATTPSSSLSP